MKKESYTCGNKDKRVNSCVINRRLKKNGRVKWGKVKWNKESEEEAKKWIGRWNIKYYEISMIKR